MGENIMDINIEIETERDPNDASKCITRVTKFEINLNEKALEKLKNMISLDPSAEWDESCDRGNLYMYCIGRYVPRVVDPESNKLYNLVIENKTIDVTSSNAIEVCDRYGCRLVPACETGKYTKDISIYLEESEMSLRDLVEEEEESLKSETPENALVTLKYVLEAFKQEFLREVYSEEDEDEEIIDEKSYMKILEALGDIIEKIDDHLREPVFDYKNTSYDLIMKLLDKSMIKQ